MKSILFSVVPLYFLLLVGNGPTIFSESTGAYGPDTSVVNPNGSSELAQLMREMQQYSIDAKKAVLENKTPAPYPKDFDKIYTATISKGMSKSEHYNTFADMYVHGVKSYANSAPQNRIDTYNNMVSSCIACHSQHCPGPVPVIKKLLIPTEK